MHENKLQKTKEQIIIYRASTIPYTFLGIKVNIYNGFKYKKKTINKWTIGYKFGELTWNKKIAIYKKKKKK
jgi:ribosomal protein S19